MQGWLLWLAEDRHHDVQQQLAAAACTPHAHCMDIFQIPRVHTTQENVILFSSSHACILSLSLTLILRSKVICRAFTNNKVNCGTVELQSIMERGLVAKEFALDILRVYWPCQHFSFDL